MGSELRPSYISDLSVDELEDLRSQLEQHLRDLDNVSILAAHGDTPIGVPQLDLYRRALEMDLAEIESRIYQINSLLNRTDRQSLH